MSTNSSKRNISFIACLFFVWHVPTFAEKDWPEYPLRGTNLKLVAATMLNSVKVSKEFTEDEISNISNWGVNVVRVDLNLDIGSIWDVGKGKTPPPIPTSDPLAPYRKSLDAFEKLLNLASKYHFFVIPSANNIVGRRIDVMYQESDGSGYYKTLEQLWVYIAKKFGQHPRLLAYDLLNEPNSANELANWQQIVLPKLASKIRNFDKNTYLLIEPGPWGLPDGFINFVPLNDPKVVYSFHFYAPHNYTHQGVGQKRMSNKGKLSYPGKLKMFDTSPEMYWDRDQMLKYVTAVRNFQKINNAKILVGEFSAIRWAPGSAVWLRDAISVFEENRWDWCYHSYGGWNGWNPTFEADDPESSQTDGGKSTDRLKVLLEYWGKNTRL